MNEKGSSNFGYENDVLKLSEMKSDINNKISTINNDAIFESVYFARK
jgi:hypothetical protein